MLNPDPETATNAGADSDMSRLAHAAATTLARLSPDSIDAEPSDELRRSLAFLDAGLAPETVVAAGYGAALPAGVLGGLVALVARLPTVTVVFVALAAALLSAALPAVESAAADRTASVLDRDVDRIERAGASLLADDAPGGRRVLTISVPAGSLVAAGVDSVILRCRPGCVVRYVLGSGAVRTRRIELPLVTPDGAVRFGTPGDHRLVLGLAEGDDGRVVTVRG